MRKRATTQRRVVCIFQGQVIPCGTRHHLLFTRAEWKNYSSTTRALRRAFSRKIPKKLHAQLHQEIDAVPVPPEGVLNRLLANYERDKRRVDEMNILSLCDWVMNNANGKGSKPFRETILKQRSFLSKGDRQYRYEYVEVPSRKPKKP